MGCLRLILALSVVLAHTGPLFGNTLVGGAVAVETFFMISGFYMALVINEKYFAKASVFKSAYKLFLEARALRLYPLYIFITVITVAMQMIFFRSDAADLGEATPLVFWTRHAHEIRWESLSLIAATNLLLVGQDVVMFLGLNSHKGQLFFTSDFHTVSVPAWRFLFVPQAWSLGLEISFYAVAPLIVKNKLRILLVIALSSYALKHILGHIGLHDDPWSYRFFPSELLYFVLGAIGYKGYVWLQERQAFQAYWGVLSLFCAFASILLFSHLHSPREIDGYFCLMTINIPLIFLFTKQMRWDRLIGELSYPVYLCHIFVIHILKHYGHDTPRVACCASLALAVVLLYAFEQPLEHWRKIWIQKREDKSGKAEPLPVAVSPATA